VAGENGGKKSGQKTSRERAAGREAGGNSVRSQTWPCELEETTLERERENHKTIRKPPEPQRKMVRDGACTDGALGGAYPDFVEK